jgi:hypothetical protein
MRRHAPANRSVMRLRGGSQAVMASRWSHPSGASDRRFEFTKMGRTLGTWRMLLRASVACLLSALGVAATGCAPARSTSATPPLPRPSPAPPAGLLAHRPLENRAAYVPLQCFTNTRAEDRTPKNPCYVCHTRSEPPNFANDEDLQLALKLPLPSKRNPWTNLLSPPVTRAPPENDADILEYVERSNYFDATGNIALARALEAPPVDWDDNANGRWDGFIPDVEFRFDDRGFDRGRDGTPTGWRAFAYYPFPGTFFPTNGSADDVLIRLDPALRQDDGGHPDEAIYALNLAVVEALITRADVAIDPVDEAAVGVDLDLDGRLGRATRVAFDDARDGRGGTRMRYVGLARQLQQTGRLPIAVGLFPPGTEFFHTVRYLDVGADGVVTMAPRLKELRYARKVRWLTYEQLRRRAQLETKETARTPDGTQRVPWLGELGVANEQGWYFQGFIEDRGGSLRPQSIEESTFCEGCHGGIGATTDSIFSFARKLGARAPARGWYHWSQHDLRGLAEPRRQDGRYEYTLYLGAAGAGDELRSNVEVTSRFFDAQGGLRPEEVEKLHADVSRLLLPTGARALDLDRAYRAIVLDQSFDRGRDAVLASSTNVLSEPVIGGKTGIEQPLVAVGLAR